MSKSLYRIVPFEFFVGIVLQDRFTFRRPQDWDDPYEGVFFKLLETDEGKQRIADIIKKLPTRTKASIPPAEVQVGIAAQFSKILFAQSWTRHPESEALWRSYAHGNKAIRIEVSRADLAKIPHIKVHDIEYVPRVSLESSVKRVFHDGNVKIGEAICIKRADFRYEQEVRLIADLDGTDLPTQPSLLAPQVVHAFTKKLEEINQISSEERISLTEKLLKGHGEQRNVKHFYVPSVANIMQSAMLHPLAPDWFDEIVGVFCQRHNIHYLGRSDLYRISI